MDWNDIQGAITDGLLIAGTVVLALIASFFIARRWIIARLLGLILMIIATQSAPADVVWWAPLALMVASIGGAYFITRSIIQPTTEQLLTAFKPYPIGDIRSALAVVPAAIRQRSVLSAKVAVKELVIACGIRRMYVGLAGIAVAAALVAATFRLNVFGFLALVLSAVLVGGAFLIRRATAAVVVADPEADAPVAGTGGPVAEPAPALEA